MSDDIPNLECCRALLKTHLCDILELSKDNPLNLLLPAYETMWRLVLHLLLEVMYRSHDDERQWQEIFTILAQSPTLKVFDKEHVPSGLTARDIVKEGLRLYPPTRRIYRSYSDRDIPGKKTLKAVDVEALHRKPEYWGSGSCEFKPSRWSQLADDSEIKACVPFGRGSLSCPAKKDAGYLMAGMIVAVLVEQLKGRNMGVYVSDPADDGGLRAPGPLRTGRNEFGGLLLEVKVD